MFYGNGWHFGIIERGLGINYLEEINNEMKDSFLAEDRELEEWVCQGLFDVNN